MVAHVTMHLRPHQRSRDVATALSAGFRRHGVRISVRSDEQAHSTDVAVVWGARQRALWEAYRAAGVPILCAEQGYVGDRNVWTSLGWNGLNGYADHVTIDPPSDRWERFHAQEMQPWRSAAGAVVIMGQVPGDAAVRVPSLPSWYAEMVHAVKAVTDSPVWFRPHPESSQAGTPDGVECVTGPLSEVLGLASLVVTHTSTVGVQAALAGVPVVATDRGSMAHPIASEAVTAEAFVRRPDRAAWAHRLAYRQWRLEEMASGEAWAYQRECVAWL